MFVWIAKIAVGVSLAAESGHRGIGYEVALTILCHIVEMQAFVNRFLTYGNETRQQLSPVEIERLDGVEFVF